MTLLKTLERYNPGTGYGELGELAKGQVRNRYAKPSHQTYLDAEYERVLRSATKYHINPVILWGVYGAETSHGSDIKPSSTGAQGPFQFEPETAQAYGYPIDKNTHGVTNLNAFQQQSDATARYLASLLPGGKGEVGLKAGKGWEAAWEKALRAYSGGGYGLAVVKQRGSAAHTVVANEAHNQAEAQRTAEGEKFSLPGLFGELGKFALEAVLLIIGAVLVIYGIMVAVRPRERATAIPIPV